MGILTDFGQWIGFVGSVGVVGGIYSFAIERFWLEIRQVRLPLPQLPHAFSGFRIVLWSDAHLGFFFSPRHLSRVADRINALQPDLIVFAGDLIDKRAALNVLQPAVPVLAKLNAPYGKYAVLGNHDYRKGIEPVIGAWESGGFRVLRNEHVEVNRGKQRFFLVGLDDVLKGKPDLNKAADGIPEASCKILLVHEPDYADSLERSPVDLQLSGHSHGGQVRLPFVGPVLTTKLGKKYHTGLCKTKRGMVYTNRGLGTTALPFRFLCRPEITVITLETE